MLTDTSNSSINNGDFLRWNGTHFVNSSTLTSDETNITTVLVGQAFVKNASSVTQNETITIQYVDNTAGHAVQINNSPAFLAPISAHNMGADYGSPSLSNPYLTLQTGTGGMP